MIQRLTDFAATTGNRTAVTVGNFDGCHLGHQALVRAAVGHGERLAALPTAVTFSPRPDAFFRLGQGSEGPMARTGEEPLLFTEAQKTRAFGELGIAQHLVQTFDAAFSRVTAEAFYQRLLKDRLGAAAVAVGDNFRFGYNRGGNAATLAAWAERDGIACTICPAASYEGTRISSTRVREALTRAGDVRAATAMLGRPYLLEGVIRRGDQLGRQLGVPTANLEGVSQLLPRFGIYAGYVWLAETADAADRPPVLSVPANAHPAVFSLGIRPTLGQEKPPVRVEAHILDGDGAYGPDALYGLRAGYYLTDWLRGEERFPGMDELKAQMRIDIEQARHRTQGRNPPRSSLVVGALFGARK